jgi:phosphatidate cytidylyltransferase
MNRVITGVVMLAIFVPALFFLPAVLWAALIALVAGVAAQEWARIAAFPGPLPVIYAAGMMLMSVVVYYLPAQSHAMLTLWAMAAVFWILVAPLWLANRWQARGVFVRALTGTLVVLPAWAAMVALRERSPWLLLGVMALVWIADTAAYFAGRRFGRHKLAPQISPGKSWEGVGGAGIALLLYASAISAAIVGLRIPGALFLAAALLYFSILGDLFESWMKRVAGVKDSGSILPGHGGVLDRIDALTAALPIAAGILHFVSWI